MITKDTAIPYNRQWISKEDINAVIDVLSSRFLTQGPTVDQFERSLASYCGINYAVAFSSATAALHGACFAAGLKHGDEVITTPLTFAASANCVLYVGATPVFVDIRKDLPLIDPNEIKKKISKRTKAIIPVDYSGLPADYNTINEIARANDLIVIADSAHSLGATYRGKNVGSLADMTVFSFHPVKTITTGEGGMVVTNYKKYYEKLLLFRTHGITKNKSSLKDKSQGDWYYEMQALGYNYRLTDIQAALGISQLKKIEIFIKKRQKISDYYFRYLKQMESIRLFPILKDRTSAWHLFPVNLATKNYRKDRKELYEKFHEAGIHVQVHYIPVHLQPYYKNRFGFHRGDFPRAERYYDGELSLPIFPKMTEIDINKVIKVVRDLTIG